jgi:hypothetical protein
VTEEAEVQAKGKVGHSALSSDLADVLIELSIALHKHAMYPEGHPSLAPACERVAQRLDPLLAERGMLSLGVARDQLVIEGVATDPKNPVLQDLAGRLHRHQLGAVSFRRGADGYEIGEVLRLLAVEADRSEEPVGLGPRSQLTAWPNITLHSLTYDALQLLEDDDDGQGSGAGAGRARAAQLWVGLARAAMATDESESDREHGDLDVETDPEEVARAIDEHGTESAYDQVIVGYLLKIADELRTTQGTEATALKKRMSKLVSSLQSNTVERLLEMGGDRAQRRRFLLNAAEGMAVDAVLELVQAASESQEQNISHSLLRMLQKLTHHAETGVGKRKTAAESAARDQITQLIRGWTLNDPNPGEYGAALEALASSGPMYSVSPQAQFRPEPIRMFQMALEVDAFGEPIERAVETLIEGGSMRWVVSTLSDADAPESSQAFWDYLCSPERLDDVLRAEPIDIEVLDAMLTKVGEDAIDPMLDVLGDSNSQQTRRVLLDRIVKLGPSVGPLAMKRLEDPRWFVQRNALAILGELPEPPADFDPSKFVQNPDARVRRESVKISLRVDEGRDRSVCAALADGDARIVRMGLGAALESCPRAAVPLIVQRATSKIAEEMRVAAVNVLGACGHPAALNALLQMTAPRKTLLGFKMPQKTTVFLAALSALKNYKSDKRVMQVIAAAKKARDPDVVRAATGVDGGGK